ncbi:GDSL esterase/lipase At5g45960-like [Diospyros lotus]|uniref:GDSL esterase/lipase At5g45960-like n=1 Tax=Diospyros lotus TaxID=55363 RepID=UPI00224CBB24|nr:GDSL esterase/lipase At5g45960-like [Diospyros lotus]
MAANTCCHFLVACLSILWATTEAQISKGSKRSSVPAIFVFGDSTVDPGNNDFIETPFRSNFPPYGRDFPGRISTGRFTNGRLVTDYVASHWGIKENVPPYLNSSLGMEELMTGVSFASAGSGLDPLTAQISGVITMTEQLEYFEEYIARLEVAIGVERAHNLIKKAAYVVSVGTNDFVVNYFGLPTRRLTYTLAAYQDFLLRNLHQFIQGLADKGVEKMGLVGLPPMGCLPLVITLQSPRLLRGSGCVESISAVAREYNQMLQDKFTLSPNGRPRIVYADIYTPLHDIIQRREFGFDVVSRGCCGSGLLEASFLCNEGSDVCADASKFVFWDSIHPTDRVYYFLFKSLIPVVEIFLQP